MGTNTLTDGFRLAQLNAVLYSPINFATDTLQALLVNATGAALSQATMHGYQYESSFNANEVTGTGYTARGMAPGGQSVTQTSSVVTVTCSNPSWATSTITASGAWFVKHLSTAATSPAIGFWDFGGSIVSTSGTFLVTVAGTGLFTQSGG